MAHLNAGAEAPPQGGGRGLSSSDRLCLAAPRIIETWIERVANRRAAADGVGDRWIAAYRAFGSSALQQVADRLRGDRTRMLETSTQVIGEMVVAGRRSGALASRVVDDLLLLVPATLSELPGDRRTGLRGEMVSDQIGSAVMAVARGLEAMADRMDRERTEGFSARLEMLVHEVHNRFGAADTASRLLSRGSTLADPASVRRMASLIQTAIDDGLRTVDDIRSLTVPGTRAEPDPWPVALPALIRDVVREYEAMAADHGVDVTLSGTIPDVVVDGYPLRMVLSNLVRNALTSHDEASIERTVAIAAERPGPRRVVVAVRDNGTGIGEERREAIFLPGTRRDDAPTVRQGFGLAVAREASERMDGAVEVVSGPGAGSTFRVTFTCLTTEGPADEMGRLAPGSSDGSGPPVSDERDAPDAGAPP